MSGVALVLRSTSGLARLIAAPGHYYYLTSISRTGRTTRWSVDAAKAMQMPRRKWDALKARYPTQAKGRLVAAGRAIK